MNREVSHSRTSRYVPLRTSTGSGRSSPEVPMSPILPQPGAGDPVNREVSHSCTSRYVPLRTSTGSGRSSSPEVLGRPILPQPQPGAGDPVNREVSHSRL